MQQSTQAKSTPCNKSSLEMGNLDRVSRSSGAFTFGHPPRTQHSYVVRVEDRLWLPFTGKLPPIVRTLLRRGERSIVLDLACVTKIDAAGIGDLVRAYNIAAASNGTLRIAHTNPWVREMLDLVGLADRFNPALT